MKAHARTRTRLLLRDLSAAAAFGAMAVSGELPLWAVALFLIGLGLALFDLRALRRAGAISGVGVLGAAAALYLNVAFGSLDLVVAACSFASVITLHRMLSESTGRTDHQVLLTSLLMISGGAALSGELLFAVMLFLFAAFACCSLVLGVVERTVRPGAQLRTGPVMRRMGAGVMFAVLGAILCFVFIPRVSWNAMARRASKGFGGVTGLSDGVRLNGEGGSIKSSPRVVARIKLNPDPGSDELNAHWIASTYGGFDGAAWTDGGDRRPASTLVQFGARGPGDTVHQKIELLPSYGSRVAVALVDPVSLGHAFAHRGNSHTRTRMIEMARVEVRLEDEAAAYTYHAYSAQAPRSDGPQRLPPKEALRLTALPASLDPRIGKLAARVLDGEKDPLRAARKLERHLKEGYAYTLELPDGPTDPLADFLFDRKRGHCEYFASALAVLLRTQGIPAKVATGFYGGTRIGDQYVLRAGDAHAWTQVFIEGQGFVNLDATPESGRLAQPGAVFGALASAWERLDGLWRGLVLDYSLQDQYGMALKVVSVSRTGGATKTKLPPLRAWLISAVLVLAAYGIWRHRHLGSTAAPSGAHPATRMRTRAEALLGAHGLCAGRGEGLEELSARLVLTKHDSASALSVLTSRYVESRFGGRPLSRSEADRLLAQLQASFDPRAAARAA